MRATARIVARHLLAAHARAAGREAAQATARPDAADAGPADGLNVLRALEIDQPRPRARTTGNWKNGRGR